MFTVHLSLSVDEDDVLVNRLLVFTAFPRHAPLHVIHRPDLANLGQYQIVFLILKTLIPDIKHVKRFPSYLVHVVGVVLRVCCHIAGAAPDVRRSQHHPHVTRV